MGHIFLCSKGYSNVNGVLVTIYCHKNDLSQSKSTIYLWPETLTFKELKRSYLQPGLSPPQFLVSKDHNYTKSQFMSVAYE